MVTAADTVVGLNSLCDNADDGEGECRGIGFSGNPHDSMTLEEIF